MFTVHARVSLGLACPLGIERNPEYVLRVLDCYTCVPGIQRVRSSAVQLYIQHYNTPDCQ